MHFFSKRVAVSWLLPVILANKVIKLTLADMDHKYWDIAAKELEGKATAAEQEELRRWLEEDPEHRAQYQAQQQLWQLTAPASAPQLDAHEAWQKVAGRIRAEEGRRDAKTIPMFPAALRVAASVAVLFGLLWLGQYLFFPYWGMEIVASGDKQLSLMLPDSSQVWLNRNSKLIYDPEFAGTAREVQLKGEAFFEIRKDPRRPFIIQTDETITKVLGTSFNLRAYPGEKTVELVVATGRVAFTNKASAVEAIVIPGHAAVLDKRSNTIDKYSSPNANAWAWKTDSLQFEGQTLKEVLQDLQRYYGVALQLNNSALANCRFTGSFENNELEEVLQVLAATLQLKYSQQADQTIVLSGQGCR